LPPTPIYFLTVGRDSLYLFAVTGPEKAQALAWLRGGLSELGSGAKTGAGYGYFTPRDAATSVEPPAPVTVAPKPVQPEPELPLTWRTGTVRQYRPDKGHGKLVDDASGEELSFNRGAIEEKGWSPGKKHRIRYAVVERDGYPVVVQVRRR
jgi:CRISPR-associated protein Cmr6